VNHSLNALKKQKRLEPLPSGDHSLSGEEKSEPDIDGFLDMLEDALRTLPSTRKAVFTLSRMEGLDNEEIASYLGISKKTVENHMTMALRDIRTFFSEQKGDKGELFLFLLPLL
jgi:RNA polymerase sigma-70 factor (ECF subfamily)